MRIGIITSHPIQYQTPWFRALAERCDLTVYFAQRHVGEKLATVGFGVNVEWDVELLEGYRHQFLVNRSSTANTSSFGSCDTPEIADLIARGRFDAFIVSGWFLKSYLQAIVACKRHRVPVLVRGDSQLVPSAPSLKRTVKTLAYPLLLRAFSGFLYVGKRNREYLEHFGVPARKLFRTPHAVDTARFSTGAEEARRERAQLRRALGFEERDIIALFAGRLVPMKHPVDLIEAFRHLPAGHALRPAFVGSGALEAEIRARAQEVGVEPIFLGFRNQLELPTIYAAADMLVLPSDHRESWGLVVNEAMACGIPAVVSDAAGCTPDLIDEGVTGFSFKLGDTRALGAAMLQLSKLLGSPELSASLRAKSDAFSIARAADATITALRSVATQRVQT